MAITIVAHPLLYTLATRPMASGEIHKGRNSNEKTYYYTHDVCSYGDNDPVLVDLSKCTDAILQDAYLLDDFDISAAKLLSSSP